MGRTLHFSIICSALRCNRIGEWPERYGVQGDYVPNGFWKQMKFPFVWDGK